MIVTVCVTQEHIDNGVPMHANECMLALALRDVLDPKVTFCLQAAKGQGAMLYLSHSPKPVKVTDESVIEKVLRFDQGHKPEPFTVELDISEHLLDPEVFDG